MDTLRTHFGAFPEVFCLERGGKRTMNTELLEALEILEKEKDISKETLLEAIENSLLTACKNHFGKADNVKVNIDPKTCQFSVFQH